MAPRQSKRFHNPEKTLSKIHRNFCRKYRVKAFLLRHELPLVSVPSGRSNDIDLPGSAGCSQRATGNLCELTRDVSWPVTVRRFLSLEATEIPYRERGTSCYVHPAFDVRFLGYKGRHAIKSWVIDRHVPSIASPTSGRRYVRRSFPPRTRSRTSTTPDHFR